MADATLTAAELQRALHIDSPDELENAQSLQAAAEIYLENAGVERDYGNALYKQVVVNYIARLMDQPDLLTNLSETNGFVVPRLMAPSSDSFPITISTHVPPIMS